MKTAFPFNNSERLCLFIKLKTTNFPKLKEVIENFIDSASLFATEHGAVEEFKHIFTNLSISIGNAGDNCIISIPLDQNELFEQASQMINQMIEFSKSIGLYGFLGIATAVSLKNILNHVTWFLPKVNRAKASDPKESKSINEKSNLLKLIFCGAAFRVRCEVKKTALPQIRSLVYETLHQDNNQLSSDKFLAFIMMAFKGFAMRVKLSEEETLRMVKEYFEGRALPDGADLVDEIGSLLSTSRLIEYYDNVPFIREFIDGLHKYARCNIELGMHIQSTTASFHFSTEGVKELFDLIMEGMADA